MAFLNIETKEDSAAKTAAAAGKPHNQFLWAAEQNLIRDKVNELRLIVAMIGLSYQQLEALGEVIELGDLGVTSVKDAINAGDPRMLGETSPTLIRAQVEGKHLVYLFTGPIGSYGAGQPFTMLDSHLQVVTESASPLSKKYHSLLSLYNPGPPSIMDLYASEIPGLSVTQTDVGTYLVTAPGLNSPRKASVRVHSPLAYVQFTITYVDDNTIKLESIFVPEGIPVNMPLVGVNLEIQKFL
jgi:hypothetical protein